MSPNTSARFTGEVAKPTRRAVVSAFRILSLECLGYWAATVIYAFSCVSASPNSATSR